MICSRFSSRWIGAPRTTFRKRRLQFHFRRRGGERLIQRASWWLRSAFSGTRMCRWQTRAGRFGNVAWRARANSRFATAIASGELLPCRVNRADHSGNRAASGSWASCSLTAFSRPFLWAASSVARCSATSSSERWPTIEVSASADSRACRSIRSW
jgi:hypothetical protein